MKFIVKKTNELSQNELAQLSSLFEVVFGKKRTVEMLLNQYVYNVLGYSYHSMIIDNNRIVALNTYVPAYYLVKGERRLFANSVDSMVEKPYRDFFNFKDMVCNAYKYMSVEGVSFVYGYPNNNSYPVLTKSKLMRPIGKMYIYCLPYRIGGIKPQLKCLNRVSIFFCKGFLFLSSFVFSSKPLNFLIHKEEISYNMTRYKRGEGLYTIVEEGGVEFVYKIKKYDGIKTAFLIDLSVKSSESFHIAIKHIIKNHDKEFDLILYPGYLSICNISLIRLPRKIEPKKFNLTGHALDKDLFDNTIWSIDNWDTNLSNYDLI